MTGRENHDQWSFKGGGTTAVLAFLAGEIQIGQLSPVVRESLPDSVPQLEQVDLRKFIDVRFVKAR